MAHTLTANLRTSYFNTATLAYMLSKTDTLVLTAMAFPVTSRSKDTLAEQTVTLWL